MASSHIHMAFEMEPTGSELHNQLEILCDMIGTACKLAGLSLLQEIDQRQEEQEEKEQKKKVLPWGVIQK